MEFVTLASRAFGDTRPSSRAPGKLSADNSYLARAATPGSKTRLRCDLIPPSTERRAALLLSIREAALNDGDGYPGVCY